MCGYARFCKEILSKSVKASDRVLPCVRPQIAVSLQCGRLRAGMVMRETSPNHRRGFETHWLPLVFSLQTWSMLLPLPFVVFLTNPTAAHLVLDDYEAN